MAFYSYPLFCYYCAVLSPYRRVFGHIPLPSPCVTCSDVSSCPTQTGTKVVTMAIASPGSVCSMLGELLYNYSTYINETLYNTARLMGPKLKSIYQC